MAISLVGPAYEAGMTRIAATEAGDVARLLRAGSCCLPLASGRDQHAITPLAAAEGGFVQHGDAMSHNMAMPCHIT
jgi:hypothetical protein